MTNEELLQQVLNSTLDRLGKQTVYYEAEIAKLNSQIIIIGKQLEEFKQQSQEDTSIAKSAINPE